MSLKNLTAARAKDIPSFFTMQMEISQPILKTLGCGLDLPLPLMVAFFMACSCGQNSRMPMWCKAKTLMEGFAMLALVVVGEQNVWQLSVQASGGCIDLIGRCLKTERAPGICRSMHLCVGRPHREDSDGRFDRWWSRCGSRSDSDPWSW